MSDTDVSLVNRTHESRDRYQSLVEANPAQLWTAQPDGGLDYVNPQVASYAGMPAELLLGNGWGQMVHPLDLSRAVEQWRRCLASGETYSVEMRLQCGVDSIYRWHLTNAVAIRDAAGQIVQWVGTNVNIDEQKRALEIATAAQSHAHKERERLRRIFQYAPAAMILYQGANFVIDLLNPVAQEMFGARVVQGKPVREAFPELESQGIFELMDRVHASGEPHQAVELCLLFDRNGDGVPEETFWNVTLQPLNEPDEPTTEILSHAVEVTALVRARKRLETLESNTKLQ